MIRASGRGTPLVRRLAFVVAAMILVLFASADSFWGDVPSVAVPLMLAMMLYLAPLFMSPSPDPFEPAVFSGLYQAYSLAGVLASLFVSERLQFNHLPPMSGAATLDLGQTVAWSFVIAISCYYVGYYAPFAPKLKVIFPTLSKVDWRPNRVVLVCAGAFLIFLPIYALFQNRLGLSLTTLTDFTAGKRASRGDITETWIVRGILFGFLPPMLLLAWVLPNPRKRWYVLAIGALTVLLSLLVIRTGLRGAVGFFLITMTVIFHYLRRRVPAWFIFVAAFVAVGGMNFLGELRFEQVDDVRARPTKMFRPVETLAAYEGDRGRLDGLGIVFYHIPTKQDFLLGESWAVLIYSPIPKWLWPEKGEYMKWADHGLAWQLGGGGMPVQFHGALYANFSWFGIVIGMALWGAVQRGMYEWLRKDSTNPSKVLLYANLITIFAPTVLAILSLFQFVLPLYLVLIFIRIRRGGALSRARVGAGAVAVRGTVKA